MTLPDGYRALVVAPGAIGRAMAAGISGDPRCGELIVAGRREALFVDFERPETIAALFARLEGPLHLVLVTGGLLHDAEVNPERALREIDAAALARLYAVNAIGPALVARHAEPLIPRDVPACFAMMGARVGSISDNRLGGWVGYRMAKAGAAQFVRTLSLEWRRTRPLATALLLHPGTVDSALSAPFQRGVAPDRLFTPDHSAAALLDVIAAAGPERSGDHVAWDGTTIPA
ncbi:C-factor [Sphingomonas sp. ASV193]|uniref:C-factor n=1 Tax=Sphingomonas sp. ASV193 TaxID=3144405 RepID=UPI0032E91D12